MYPESAPSQPAAKPATYDGEKTSVATDINSLMAGLGGHQAQGGGGDDLATEVISGDALANFNFGSSFPSAPPAEEEGTVEMQNPLSLLNQGLFGGGGGELGDAMTEMTMDEGDLKTEVATGLSFDHMSLPSSSPAPAAPPMFGGGPSFGAPQSSPAPPPTPSAPPAFTTPASAPPAMPPSRPQAAPPLPSMAPPVAAPPVAAPPVAAPPVAPVAAPPVMPVAGPDASHAGPWKLKTDFGLTYEFQDTKSLIGWMSGRESLTNYELSAGEGDFYAWSDFPQIGAQLQGDATGLGEHSSAAYHNSGKQEAIAPGFQNNQSSGFPTGPQAPVTGQLPAMQPGPSPAFQTGPLPSQTGPLPAQRPPAYSPSATGPAQVVSGAAYSPPSRDAKWNVLLWVLFVVLALGCLALAAQIFGIVNFKALVGMDSGEPPVVTQPVVVDTPDEQPQAPDEEPAAAVSKADKAMAKTLLEDGRREMEANHLASARDKLESALKLDPKLAEAYMVLSKVYAKTGQEDKAKEMQKKMQSLSAGDIQMDEGTPIMP